MPSCSQLRINEERPCSLPERPLQEHTSSGCGLCVLQGRARGTAENHTKLQEVALPSPERAKKGPWAGIGCLGLSMRTGPQVRKGLFGGWTRLSLRTASKARHSWRDASGTGLSANLPFGHLGRCRAPCTHCLSVLERGSRGRRIQPEVRTG